MERLSKKQIEDNLRVYGFKLGWSADESIDKQIAVEELIIDILKGVDEPRYINGLPVIIAKNMESLRFDHLAKRAEEENVANAVGWILEESKESFERKGVSYKRELADTIKLLEKIKTESETFLGYQRENWYVEHVKENRGILPKKWGIMAFCPSDEFDRLLMVYRCLSQ